MKKYTHWLYIMGTVLIATVACRLIYNAALSSYTLNPPSPDYFATVMLLQGLFGIADLVIAVSGVFLCIKFNQSK